MSRYRDPRSSGGDLPYRDGPPQRWNTDRYARERDYRGPPGFEERPPYDDYRSPPRRAPVMEERKYFEEDRYGPGGARVDRRYFQEDDYYGDPRAAGGAMIPFRPERPARPNPVPRPGIIRRQSSLDTFDRRPIRRYDDYDDYAVGPPRRESRYRADARDYADVRVSDPYHYGDDGFREYREREWVTSKRRNSSGSRSRSRERESAEKPYPRRGKTKMPRRRVHTKALYDLGYPFYELDEKTIMVSLALGPENINQVFTLSEEYFEKDVSTTRLIEAPPGGTTYREEKITKEEKVATVPLGQAPRSVREWDALSVRSPSPKSVRSHSRRRSRRGSGTVIEEKITERVIERSGSPARSQRTAATRRRSYSGSDTEVERTKIIAREEYEDSAPVNVGPLALVVDRRPSRNDRDLKEEIRALEAERRALRRERRYDDDTEIVKVERLRERSPSPRGEVVIERRGEEIVEVRKDKRVRSRSVAPSAKVIKAMMATLT